MAKGIYARLTRQEAQVLLQLAHSKRRDVRDQAAYLIRRELERLGLIQSQTVKGVQSEPERQAA